MKDNLPSDFSYYSTIIALFLLPKYKGKVGKILWKI